MMLSTLLLALALTPSDIVTHNGSVDEDVVIHNGRTAALASDDADCEEQFLDCVATLAAINELTVHCVQLLPTPPLTAADDCPSRLEWCEDAVARAFLRLVLCEAQLTPPLLPPSCAEELDDCSEYVSSTRACLQLHGCWDPTGPAESRIDQIMGLLIHYPSCASRLRECQRASALMQDLQFACPECH